MAADGCGQMLQGWRALQEILKSNNPVELNYAEVILKDAGIPCVVFDGHMSVMDGSMVILPRRLMVADADLARAVQLLKDAFAAPSPIS